jgi:hypothetical protein
MENTTSKTTGADIQTRIDTIRLLIGDGEPATSDNRRRHRRYPLACAMRLTPIDDHGNLLRDKTIEVLANDISMGGIGFSHDDLLPYRRAVITFTHRKSGRLAFEVKIAWTRQVSLGQYESGCEIIKEITEHELDVTGRK